MNFALVGVAGYIAPRHLQAIKRTGNDLSAATDPHDAVGVLDSYFHDVPYFREFERFDRHVERLRRGPEERRVNYVSICSPNYLHDAHIRFALRVGAHAICEKPLVLNPWNCEALLECEQEYGRRVFTVLQLRLHPAIMALKEKFSKDSARGKKHKVSLRYITSRGPWYLFSWKGDESQSGGLATNIGIHFFDMLMWIFGKTQSSEVSIYEPTKAAGRIELERAEVEWLLSTDRKELPSSSAEAGRGTFRSIMIDGEEVEFSEGFTDLHIKVYEDILAGKGFGVMDAMPSISLVQSIRAAGASGRIRKA